MLTSKLLYNGVSIALGVVCLVSIALAFRSFPDKSPKKPFIIGLVLMLLTSILMPVCLHFVKLHSAAQLGVAAGRVDKEVLEMIYRIADLATVGSVLELLAVILLVGVSKTLILQHVAKQAEGGVEQ